MKKVFFCLLAVVCFAAPAVWAQDLGEARYTDVTAYINHYPIPSYNFNGYTLICAEDLEGYGFDVQWDPVSRTLQLNRGASNSISPLPTFAPPQYLLNQASFTVCTTDVRVYSGGYELAALGGLPGKTLINVQDLACMDQTSVQWVPEVRAVKVWIEDGLDMLAAPWEVRELDPNMPLYRHCYYAEPHWSCVGTKDALLICLAFRDADGYYAGGLRRIQAYLRPGCARRQRQLQDQGLGDCNVVQLFLRTVFFRPDG